MGFIGFSGGKGIKLTVFSKFRCSFTLVFINRFGQAIWRTFKTHQLLSSVLVLVHLIWSNRYNLDYLPETEEPKEAQKESHAGVNTPYSSTCIKSTQTKHLNSSLSCKLHCKNIYIFFASPLIYWFLEEICLVSSSGQHCAEQGKGQKRSNNLYSSQQETKLYTVR